MDGHQERFLTLRQTAAELHVSTATLSRMIARGEIQVTRISGRTFVERRDLETYIAGAKTTGPRAQRKRESK